LETARNHVSDQSKQPKQPGKCHPPEWKGRGAGGEERKWDFRKKKGGELGPRRKCLSKISEGDPGVKKNCWTYDSHTRHQIFTSQKKKHTGTRKKKREEKYKCRGEVDPRNTTGEKYGASVTYELAFGAI